ncbi:MAG: winged helix DNA-binding domain-containing protein [Chloroflexi bacterium]|nr:winged helix DNA-binding domain-containing protein [Chloroflexota bacterium]MCI0578805.1 winged helix DNA-binding domain-containing protein [Chloroflexota bacterium]MCI0644699.1 winged helix DNA-binding domain-containing protein [Chloroflexota bacterium]MCI0730397.1 winged helix DNA-binding domain-containing protein [Chloroflexota bacterium]
MIATELTLTPTLARRLAISRQRLAGRRPPADLDGIMNILRDIRCLQLDPIRAVERTQYLVLWSRLGHYNPADLDRLLWQERCLFEYWAHAASIVLTEDYALFQAQMRDWGSGNGIWVKRAREWMAKNTALAEYILAELAQRGPLPSDYFESDSSQPGVWSSGRHANWMVEFLWTQGRVMVAGRSGQQRLWDLAERCLPAWTPRQEWEWPQVVYDAAQKSLRGLGVARPNQISRHFTRKNYPGLNGVLKRLAADGRIVPAQIVEDGQVWPGPWYVHADDVPLVEALANGDWRPRTTLLSPFDNLICDRERTEQFFNFFFRVEIYVPKAKRQYGYYVLPILHGDRIIGRVDPRMDRQQKRLIVNAVYAEPAAPQTAETGAAVAGAIAELATFLGANEVVYGETVPAGWQKAFQ